jgi:hypothetical protein
VDYSRVKGGMEETNVGHDVFAKVGVGVSPCGTVLNDIVCSGCAELGHHQWCCCGGDDDCA